MSLYCIKTGCGAPIHLRKVPVGPIYATCERCGDDYDREDLAVLAQLAIAEALEPIDDSLNGRDRWVEVEDENRNTIWTIRGACP